MKMMSAKLLMKLVGAGIGCTLAFGGAARSADSAKIAGSSCTAPPLLRCPEGNCAPDVMAAPGEAVEPKSGRKFYLDFPCDLKPGEKVNFILNIHGATSISAWQRQYFPALDFKEKYRLVIATPTSATANRI